VKHAQFCPIAKASEVIGERWMLLVIRELLAGATGFTELQRGLGSISPSVLSSRLRTLVEHGIVERVGADSSKGRYRLTQSGRELEPIVVSVGTWGRRWVRSRMTRDELDVELLMLHIGRSFDTGAFAKDQAVVGFVFGDLHGPARHWWLRLAGGETELCADFPGRAEDVTLTCQLRTMAEVFSGDISIKAAVAEGLLKLEGLPKLTRNVQRWLRISPFATVDLPEPRLASAR
jgi:DNA-binding HxlR family transcriptional regulator